MLGRVAYRGLDRDRRSPEYKGCQSSPAGQGHFAPVMTQTDDGHCGATPIKGPGVRLFDRCARLMARISSLPQPVIAQVTVSQPPQNASWCDL